MHIEPGFIAPAKVALANASALALLGWQLRQGSFNPLLLLRTLLAALFFSLFMQGFHLPVGPSELHFVGAISIYLLFGFTPTLLGFGLGLLLQGLLFEPTDLPHLAVNSLSLMIPLVVMHRTLGKRFTATGAPPLGIGRILRLDALFYGGMALMVGFWLAIGETATPLAAWLTWASSYLGIVVCEPLLTYATLRLLHRHREQRWVTWCCGALPVPHRGG